MFWRPARRRISLTNNGDEPHHAQLFKLNRDATLDDLAPAFATGDPGRVGVTHLAHGMLRGFEVTGGPADPARSPALLKATNAAASEPHELIVARLHDGADADDVRDAMTAGTPPPATFVGGAQAILPGASQALQLGLEPGAYVVLCGIPSPDGKPHHAKGMIHEVTVAGDASLT